MKRNPWRTRDGRKVLKAACVAAGVAASMQEEIGDGQAEKIVREWLVRDYGAYIAFSPVGTVWSVNGQTRVDLGDKTRIRIEFVSGYWGHDTDTAKALIAAGLAVLKGGGK